MKLHLDKENFAGLLSNIRETSNIDADILEKDYFVCVVLEQLSQRQDELKAYFKGGTAIYKKLADMRRFSEDIDLTVRDDETLSNKKNKHKLEESAEGYSTEGLQLACDMTDKRKGSVTAFYKYESAVSYDVNPLRRAGEIQVEATSFTESEPIEDCEIQPLIYKLATADQRAILESRYDVAPFNVATITLERAFIDKLFAAQKYLGDLNTPALSRPVELAKHLYDIAVLFKEARIHNFLTDKSELARMEIIRRREEQVRVGGVSPDVQIADFDIFKLPLPKEAYSAFDSMQAKYVLQDKYEISVKVLNETLASIHEALKN
ncbi:MAG: nucleotidyl transferase AbiEii/AbiGii toxin family protein [Oscillospiraceae bacterium]|nr:nucleotidyl transferase AbiEii/AbiGii toxin family protein [Oscillospiraceae bacterium]